VVTEESRAAGLKSEGDGVVSTSRDPESGTAVNREGGKGEG